MIRQIARIGMIVGLAATLAATLTNTAAAAPTGFAAVAAHAGGAGATATSSTGAMSWSTSLRTVTLTNVKFFVKGGECATLLMGGFQGGTLVTSTYRYPASGSACPPANRTYPLGTVTLTATVPGGVQDVFITATDDSHDVTGWADCYRTASSCETGQF